MPLRPQVSETIVGHAEALRAGRTTCIETVKSCLMRLDAREPMLRAWVVTDPHGALEQAQALDAELANGQDRGPMLGVPVGVKDIIDVQGLPTAAGSTLWADRVPSADAPIVARLREAGAIVLGKTVTTAYAWIDPPPTANPWRSDRTPGGSSSGSAAALAAGSCLASLGSQTGGSITRPAAYCGVIGFKPTFGTLPAAGILPLAESLDHPGAFTRTATDLALVWLALAPGSAPVEVPNSPTRIGRLGGLFRELPAPAALSATDDALTAFQVSGARIVEPGLPRGFDGLLRQHRTILATEAAAEHAARLAVCPDDYPTRITALIAEGQAAHATAYVFAKRRQRALAAEALSLFEDADVLMTPAALDVAPTRETTGDPALNSRWSFLGYPTISLPVALSDEGLPLAVQLIGRPGTDSDLIGIALWAEAVLWG